jgi:very-short-patch-repair endonuclease
MAVLETVRALRADKRFVQFSLGVVTPFRAQVELVEDLLDKANLARGVAAGTAHRFQGDECDVMIFSPVVSSGIADGAATWVEKPHNLINVSVTRAREALFLIGNINVCRQQPGILGKLARYVEDVEVLRKTSPAELELFSWLIVRGWNPEIHPVIGDTEVDFVLRQDGHKLAIEVDGVQHDTTHIADDARDSFLRARGYLTLRVSARAVQETPAIVIERSKRLLS